MQRLRRWIYFFTILILVLSACTPFRVANTDTTMLGDEAIQANAVPNSPTPQSVETVQPDLNECLECHSNKDLLIETAENIEEIAESESKGVG
jgi:hypothetical protein